MKHILDEYILGVVAKRLSEVEVNEEKSNQHEFNGPSKFKSLFGTKRREYRSKFIYLGDDEEEIIEDHGTLTWYDSREKILHRAPEYRFYYSRNGVTPFAEVGDLLLVVKLKNEDLLSIIAQSDSTSEQQLLWLFDLEEVAGKFILKDFRDTNIEIGFAAKRIIESLGIGIDEKIEEDYLGLMLGKFGVEFPTTTMFSTFARETLRHVSAKKDPDLAIILWYEREEMLFKLLEKHIIEKKLIEGFGDTCYDVDNFISFSMSVHQRRKSRAGWAFDHHLAVILKAFGIYFSSQQKTERNKPDYIFPHINLYKNSNYPPELLTMLGVKTTAKDRWRQILSEADRVNVKYLLTLEAPISTNQTDEMKAMNIRLVVPKSLHNSFTEEQQGDLLSLEDFITLLLEKQTKATFLGYQLTNKLF